MSLRRFLHRPRYADVAATLALVLATGGGAYAVATVVAPDSVDTAAIQNHAVTSPKLATESVSSDKIAPGAVGSGKLADGAVTHSDIAAGAITGADIANHSLSLSDLAGASASGAINFSLAAHRCGYLTLAVPGARVGQAALFTWTGTTNPPQGIMVGPLKVTRAGHLVASACNDTGRRIIGRGVRVRVITLG